MRKQPKEITREESKRLMKENQSKAWINHDRRGIDLEIVGVLYFVSDVEMAMFNAIPKVSPS